MLRRQDVWESGVLVDALLKRLHVLHLRRLVYRNDFEWFRSLECFSRTLSVAFKEEGGGGSNLWSFNNWDVFMSARLPCHLSLLVLFTDHESVIHLGVGGTGFITNEMVRAHRGGGGDGGGECRISRVDLILYAVTSPPWDVLWHWQKKALVFMVLWVVQLHYKQQWHLNRKTPKSVWGWFSLNSLTMTECC